MQYIGKHRAERSSSKFSRTLAAAVLGGATIIGGSVATAPVAEAATAAPAVSQTRAANVWDRVAACESNGNWSINTGNGYYGGLQFSASSWRAAGGTRYANLPHRASKAQQIATAQNLLRMQGPNAWPTCSKRAGLTRANGAGSGATSAGAAASRSAARAPQMTASDRQGLTRTQVRRLQQRVGARVDGIVGPETVRLTERALGFRPSGNSRLLGSTLRGARTLV
ncbi:MAG: transglycosylase family protein [Mobilicoccus sp.]|nr:transglycosylase family protein [Mobilicoccus sp.]